jgi:hypothetical protein
MALLTAMIVVIIVGGMAAAFLTLSLSQSKAISSGSDREMALHVAEAGVEESINRLTAYSIDWLAAGNIAPATPVPPTYPTAKIANANPDQAVLGKPTLIAATAYHAAYYAVVIVGTVNGGTFRAELSNTGNNAVNTVYTGPFAPPPGVNWTPTSGYAPPTGYQIVSQGTINGVTRTLQTITKGVNTAVPFQGGLFGDVQVDALGTFFSDGFNSTKGTYASQATHTYTFPGGKTFTYADTTGSIGSNGNIITNGNVTVMGNSTPGPGGTSGPGGNVWGSTAPATSPTPLPPVTYNVPSGTPSAPNWVNNTGMTMGAAGGTNTYHMSSFSPNGKGTITINGNVTLYVDGAFSMNNQQALNITAGSKLTIYQGSGANDFTVNGQAVAGTATADRFQVYSASTGTFKFNGGSTVYAYVYAPQATFTNNGGNEFFGAIMAKSMKLSGTASFHYDEALSNIATPVPDFKIVSWVEIQNQLSW